MKKHARINKKDLTDMEILPYVSRNDKINSLWRIK